MPIQLSKVILKPKAAPSKASVSKKTPAKKGVSYENFAERALEQAPIYRDTREITISFHEFTTDKVRISKDGKYCLKFILEADKWELLYLVNPIEPNGTLTLEELKRESHQLFVFDGLYAQQDVINKIMVLARADLDALKKAKELERDKNELGTGTISPNEPFKKLQELADVHRSKTMEKIEATQVKKEQENVSEKSVIGKESEIGTTEIKKSVPKPFTFKSLSIRK